MVIKAKICGLKTVEAVEAAVKNKADYIGFVFFGKSPRNLSLEKVAEISKIIPAGIKKVGVFVDADDEKIKSAIDAANLDYIQCHGKEDIERIKDLREKFSIKVIKAISVNCKDDIQKANNYAKHADIILFDTKVSNSILPGGNGLSFDWNLLKDFEPNFPWILSGGLNLNNIEEAISISGAKAVDLSSSLEQSPGVKDPNLIAKFLKKVKNI